MEEKYLVTKIIFHVMYATERTCFSVCAAIDMSILLWPVFCQFCFAGQRYVGDTQEIFRQKKNINFSGPKQISSLETKLFIKPSVLQMFQAV